MAPNPIERSGGYFKKKWPNLKAAFDSLTPLTKKGISAKEVFDIERRYTDPRDIERATWHLHAIADEIQGQLKNQDIPDPREKMLLVWHIISNKSEGFGYELDTKQRSLTSALLNKKLNQLTLSLLTLYLAKHFNWPVTLVHSSRQYFLRWKDNNNGFNFLGHYTFNDKEFINALKVDPLTIENGVYMCEKSHEAVLAAIRYNCAMVLLGEKNRQGAYEELKIAAKLDPKNPHIFLELGIISREINELVDAEEHLTHAIKLDPNFSLAYFERMRVFLRNGDTESMEIDRIKALLNSKYDYSYMADHYWSSDRLVDTNKGILFSKYDKTQMGAIYEFGDN